MLSLSEMSQGNKYYTLLVNCILMNGLSAKTVVPKMSYCECNNMWLYNRDCKKQPNKAVSTVQLNQLNVLYI